MGGIVATARDYARNPALWAAACLAVVPAPWRRKVAGIHADKLQDGAGIPAGTGKAAEVERAANLWLVDITDRMRAIRVPIAVSDADLCDMARTLAAEAMSMGEVVPGIFVTDLAMMRERMEGFVKRYGIEPPEPFRINARGNPAGVADHGAVSRMSCHLWWRRKLRTVQARGIEKEAIALGYVHRRAEIYASDVTVERRGQQRARNAAGLEATEAINLDTGEVRNLAELAALSVANPRIRRGELMVRISGFEGVAKGLGDAAEFVTLTAPSRFHPKRSGEFGKVEDNPKYSGETPRETQKYLTRTWANIRAKLWRLNIRPYGFRIAEPHHDATPHWHLLLFVGRWLSSGRSAVARMRAVIRRYALREDGKEPGARKNRCKFVAIDWNRGTAAGYVAKYVSKNIDGGGYQVQGDIEGGDRAAITPSHRVEAWASTWGIRQFQQIGGPPVGVWRELRRVEVEEGQGDKFEAARAAADDGDWSQYVEVMGGPSVKREDLPLRTAYTRPGERWNAAAGEPEPAPLTRYQEIAPKAIFGVREVGGRAWCSRLFRWEIRRAAGDAGVGLAVEVGRPALAPSAPWSPVNNCSRGNHESGIDAGRADGNGLEAEIQDSGGARCASGAPHSGACPGDSPRSIRPDGQDGERHRERRPNQVAKPGDAGPRRVPYGGGNHGK